MIDHSQVLDIIKKQSLAILSTASLTGKTESAVMAFAIDDDLNIYMSTESDTRKVAHISTNPQTSLLVGGLENPSIQLDGTTFIGIDKTADEYRNKILSIHPDTAAYLTPTTVYLKFTPTWLRLSDFSREPVVIEELVLAPQKV